MVKVPFRVQVVLPVILACLLLPISSGLASGQAVEEEEVRGRCNRIA